MTSLHLHGGLKKTGTTTIQSFLISQHAVLSSRGVDVVLPEFGVPGHHALMSEIGGGFRTPITMHFSSMIDAPLLPHLERQITAAAGPLLLSSEIFMRRACRGEAPRMFDDLRSVGIGEITVHIFVRSLFAYINSDYVQAIKTFKSPGTSILDFAPAVAFDLVQVLLSLEGLSRLRDVTVRFHPYTALTVTRGVAVTLLEAIGVATHGLEPEPRLNPAIGPIGLEAMRQMASRLAPDAPYERKRRAAEACRTVVAELGEAHAFLIDEEVAAECVGALGALDDFSRRTWGDGWLAMLPDGPRQCNRFDPEHASGEDRRALDQTLDILEEICRLERVL